MRIFKTRLFNRWAADEKVDDDVLCRAIEEVRQGLVDANLGGHIYKKRIAVHGRGKSGDVRTIIAYRIEDHAYFIYGFAKNKRANISKDELITFKKMAVEFMSYDDSVIKNAIKAGILYEVIIDE